MDRSSFAAVKPGLEEAYEFLQAFTLARPGFTRQDGLAGIRRVKARCERPESLFGSGPDAEGASIVTGLARQAAAAAEARLKSLQGTDG